MGRVFREPLSSEPDGEGLLSNLRVVTRLMRRWGVEGASLTARFGDAEADTSTDRDGYFRIDLDLPSPPSPGQLWHQVAITMSSPVPIESTGDVFVPCDRCRFAVISDIDDTVMYTGVANKAMMMWRLFVQRAESRTAFPGMASFLRALHRGRSADQANPMFYVSRAPWAIYGVLDRFFNMHEIPSGPILFLREWGLTLQHPLPRRDKEHKRDVIREIIDHYGEAPFILIGDSGQHDPELYADIVRRYPSRVLAIYIRDVSRSAKRDRSIERLAADVTAAGSALVLADDTMAMAKHAAGEGLIAESALAEIEGEIASAS